jgi:hypothetical protein
VALAVTMLGAVTSPQNEKTRKWQTLPIASGWTFGILVVTFAGLFVLRRPDCVTNPQFWAEDGVIIFREQLVNGWLSALATPYRGYFPLLARLVAGPASIFPVSFAPLVYNLSGIAIDSVCCALFFLPRYECFMKSALLRLVLCVLAVGAFQTTEMAGTLINSMWYLVLAGILLILLPPQIDMHSRPVIAGVWCLLGLVIGASAPMLVIAIPIATYHLVRGFWRGGLISLAIAFGAFAQTLFAFFSSRGLTLAHPGAKGVAVAMVGAFAYKVMLQAMVGAGIALRLATAKWLPYVLSAVVVAALWMLCLIVLSRGSRWKILVPIYLMFASMSLPFIGRDEARFFTNLTTSDPRGERYFFLASCMFAYLVAYTLDWVISYCLLRRNGEVGLTDATIKAAALLVIFAGGLRGNFHVDRFPDLQWQMYAKRIDGWVQDRRSGKPTPAISVPINPQGLWQIDLPSLSASKNNVSFRTLQ